MLTAEPGPGSYRAASLPLREKPRIRAQAARMLSRLTWEDWIIMNVKAGPGMDRADPRDTLDDSYRQQLDLLVKLRRGVADLIASREHVELQMSTLRERERGGRHARGRRAGPDSELSGLAERCDLLRAEEEKLRAAAERLELKVGTFQIRKEVIKASCAFAEAEVSASNLWSCIADELAATGFPSWRQRESLERLWRAINDMTVARDCLGREVDALRRRHTELEGYARKALSASREDLTRQVLAQRAEIGSQLPELVAQCRSAQLGVEKIAAAYQRLAARAGATWTQI